VTATVCVTVAALVNRVAVSEGDPDEEGELVTDTVTTGLDELLGTTTTVSVDGSAALSVCVRVTTGTLVCVTTTVLACPVTCVYVWTGGGGAFATL
jgi:hypothetical protein